MWSFSMIKIFRYITNIYVDTDIFLYFIDFFIFFPILTDILGYFTDI